MYRTWEFHLCPRDKENLPVNQKVTMSHFRKGHFVFFSFSPILWTWNEMKWKCPMRQTVFQAVSDHLFLAPDVTAASLRSALLHHTAETAQVDESIHVVCFSSVLEDHEYILNSGCSYRSVLLEGNWWPTIDYSNHWNDHSYLSSRSTSLTFCSPREDANNDIRTFSWPQPSVLHINAYGYIIKCTPFYIMHHVYCFSSRPQAEAPCDMTGKTQTGVAKSSGPFGAVLGLLLGALALFLFTASLDSSCKGNIFTAF